jgi:hypothetical protein
MKSISFFTLVFIILSILASCKKDANKELTNKEILTSHGWKFSSIVDFGTAYSGYQYGIQDCNKDDCMFFRSDGTSLVKVGNIKCDPNEQDHVSTWVLSDDGYIVTGGSSDTYTSIFSIEMNKLVLKWEYNGSGFYTTYIPC